MDIEGVRDGAHRATVGLVAASAGLIAAGIAGVGGSLALAGGFGLAGGLLWWAGDRLAAAPTVVGYDLGWYASRLWVGALVAGGVAALAVGFSPSELQSVGGAVGMLGLANHVLRPIYVYGLRLAGRIES